MEPPIIAAIISGLATLGAASLAASMIIHQLNRQASTAMAQSRLNERLKLKLQAYQQVLSICSAQQEAELGASGPIRMLRFHDAAIWEKPEQWRGAMPQPAVTAHQLMECVGKAKEAAIEIIYFTERWRVIEPRLDLFQMAANAVLYSVTEATTPLVNLSMRVMPPPPQYAPPAEWEAPSGQVLIEFKDACDAALEGLGALSLLATDFQNEMQNVLLSDLFPHRIDARQPIDPRYAPVRLDQYEQQKRYLLEETGWGKSVSATERNVREALSLSVPQSPDLGVSDKVGKRWLLWATIRKLWGGKRS